MEIKKTIEVVTLVAVVLSIERFVSTYFQLSFLSSLLVSVSSMMIILIIRRILLKNG